MFAQFTSHGTLRRLGIIFFPLASHANQKTANGSPSDLERRQAIFLLCCHVPIQRWQAALCSEGVSRAFLALSPFHCHFLAQANLPLRTLRLAPSTNCHPRSTRCMVPAA